MRKLWLPAVAVPAVAFTVFACLTPPEEGASAGTEDWFVFHGSTPDQNRHNVGGIAKTDLANALGQSPFDLTGLGGLMWFLPPLPGEGVTDPDLRMLGLITKTTDIPETDPVALGQEMHQGPRKAVKDYLREASYYDADPDLATDLAVVWDPGLHELPGASGDYYYGDFRPTQLLTNGLNLSAINSAATDGQQNNHPIVPFHIRTRHGENYFSNIEVNGVFTSVDNLAQAMQDVLQSTTDDEVVVEVSAVGSELLFHLRDDLTGPATFVRIHDDGPQALALMGLRGPYEQPGGVGGAPRMRGRPVPDPSNLAPIGFLEFELWNADREMRRATVTFIGTTFPSVDTLSTYIATSINQALAAVGEKEDWVEAVTGSPNRIQIKMTPYAGGNWATFTIHQHLLFVGEIGLDGPTRQYGLVTLDDVDTMKGRYTEVLSTTISSHLDEQVDVWMGLLYPETDPADLTEEEIGAAAQAALDDFRATYDAVWVVFSEGFPQDRPVYANESEYVDVTLNGPNGFELEEQVMVGFLIGPHYADAAEWTYGAGGVLGFDPLRKESHHDPAYDEAMDYVWEWGLMHNYEVLSHPVGRHKALAGWARNVQTVPLPVEDVEKHTFTMVPLEVALEDYEEALADDPDPLTHLVRVELAEGHDVVIEYRAPGEAFSQLLPDYLGYSPPQADNAQGGIFVTDVLDDWAQTTSTRPAVTVLSHSGKERAFAMRPGSSLAGLDLGDEVTYPQYPGIQIDPIGSVPASGLPPAYKVEVTRTRLDGEYNDLEIRRWHAPVAYKSKDIWIDWPGDGELEPTDANTFGNGDDLHWWPDENGDGVQDVPVLNRVRIRVHNRGTAEVAGVGVDAWWVKSGTGGALNELLGLSGLQTIPAGGSAIFDFRWQPTENPKLEGEHFCVKAEIVPPAGLVETSTFNNKASENIGQVHPTKGSPYKPVRYEFQLANPWDRAASFTLKPSLLPNGYHLAVEDRFFELGPNEVRTVQTEIRVDESMPTTLKWRPFFNLNAFHWSRGVSMPIGGVTIESETSTASELTLDLDRTIVRENEKRFVVLRGELLGDAPANQDIDLVLATDGGKTFEGTTRTKTDGSFELILEGVPAGPCEIMAYYFGDSMAPSDVGPLPHVLD